MTPPQEGLSQLRQEYGHIQANLGEVTKEIERLEEVGHTETARWWKWRRTYLNRKLRTILFELHKNGQLQLS